MPFVFDEQNFVRVAQRPEQRVIFLLLPNINLLDLAGTAQVFHVAAYMGASYKLSFCAAQAVIDSSIGLMLGQVAPLSSVSKDDLVIIPGIDLEGRTVDDKGLEPDLREWLRNACDSGARIASVCSGAFALGDAGLLDGRRCTTHWTLTSYLQIRYPRARVSDTVLYIHDKNITTSAGICSGIDMALSFVELDYGPVFTAQVARYLVIYMRRNGTQAQTSVYLEYRTHLNPGVHRVQDYLVQHATDSISLDELATIAKMSIRNLTRAFKDATGLTPLHYQHRLRLELASGLLHNPDLSIEAVALKCGFEDARHFRRLWQRHFGLSPSKTRNFSK